MGYARNIRKHINRLSKFLLRGSNRVLNFSLDAHIRTPEDALRSCRSNFFCRGVSSLSIDIGRHHFRPLVGEQQCNALSNPHRGASYERNATFQTHNFTSLGQLKREKLSHNVIVVQRTIQKGVMIVEAANSMIDRGAVAEYIQLFRRDAEP